MISVVLKRAWKPIKSDNATRKFCAVSAAPTMASERLIGKGSARSGSSFLLHAPWQSLTAREMPA